MSQTKPSLDDGQTAEILGFPIRIRIQGKGRPILLINGLARPLESWDSFIASLDDRQVIRFDVPGVGGSPAPNVPPTMIGLAQIAAGVLEVAGVERADVLGLSFGGAVAQQLAFQYPARVRALILVSTSCGFGSTSTNLDAAMTGPAHSTGEWFYLKPISAFWNTLAMASWSSIPFLASIAAPTLVLTGEHDRLVPPSNSRLLARRIVGATLMTLPAGHDLQKAKHASALAHAVMRFVDDAVHVDS